MTQVQEIERGAAARPAETSGGLPVSEDRVVERFLDRPAAQSSDTDVFRQLSHRLFDEPEYRPSVLSLRSVVVVAVVALLAVGAAALAGTAWHDLVGDPVAGREVR